jgi:uncharacterized protein (TIGR02145 family)
MRKKNSILMTLLLMIGAVSMNAQVRIGGTATPNASAILDLNASDAVNNATKGLALPRVALKSINQASPFAAHVNGMMVFNTATTTGGLDTIVQPGTYYNNGARWIKVRNTADQINSTDVSETFKTWLTIQIQNLITSNGAVTNNCPTTVVGVTPTNTYQVGDFGIAGCWTTENLRDSTNTGAVRRDSVGATEYNIVAYTYPRSGAKDSMNSSNVATLGLLYTWAAATKRTGVSVNEGFPAANAPVQGICPAGWHIPSDQEQSQLEMVIANDTAGLYSTHGFVTPWNDDYFTQYNTWRPTSVAVGHGLKMRSSATGTGSQQGTSNAYNATPATKRGFGILLPGYVVAGAALHFDLYTSLWTSSSYGASDGWIRNINVARAGVKRGVLNKAGATSVRCKKN